MSFENEINEAIKSCVIKFIATGEWLKLNYDQRISVDQKLLRDVMSSIDMANVIEIVKGDVERRIADSIMNSMATEIANDTKRIMSNTELREDLRSVIRSKIREAADAVEASDEGQDAN